VLRGSGRLAGSADLLLGATGALINGTP